MTLAETKISSLVKRIIPRKRSLRKSFGINAVIKIGIKTNRYISITKIHKNLKTSASKFNFFEYGKRTSRTAIPAKKGIILPKIDFSFILNAPVILKISFRNNNIVQTV